MLTLTFPVGPGESLAYSRAHCFRFCADGTLRGGDNFVAATHVKGAWRLGQGLHRELECDGPLVLRARRTATSGALRYGPFNHLRATAGLLFADAASLGIFLPSWEFDPQQAWHEIMILPSAPAP